MEKVVILNKKLLFIEETIDLYQQKYFVSSNVLTF